MLSYPAEKRNDIKPFWGALADIPAGWQLCDGTNGTPNMVDAFIVGAGGRYAPGDTGGSADAVVVAHNHAGVANTAGNHAHPLTKGYISYGGGSAGPWASGASHNTYTSTQAAGDHPHELAIDSSGEDGTDKNLPPYFALAWIMKM